MRKCFQGWLVERDVLVSTAVQQAEEAALVEEDKAVILKVFNVCSCSDCCIDHHWHLQEALEQVVTEAMLILAQQGGRALTLAVAEQAWHRAAIEKQPTRVVDSLRLMQELNQAGVAEGVTSSLQQWLSRGDSEAQETPQSPTQPIQYKFTFRCPNCMINPLPNEDMLRWHLEYACKARTKPTRSVDDFSESSTTQEGNTNDQLDGVTLADLHTAVTTWTTAQQHAAVVDAAALLALWRASPQTSDTASGSTQLQQLFVEDRESVQQLAPTHNTTVVAGAVGPGSSQSGTDQSKELSEPVLQHLFAIAAAKHRKYMEREAQLATVISSSDPQSRELFDKLDADRSGTLEGVCLIYMACSSYLLVCCQGRRSWSLRNMWSRSSHCHHLLLNRKTGRSFGRLLLLLHLLHVGFCRPST